MGEAMAYTELKRVLITVVVLGLSVLLIAALLANFPSHYPKTHLHPNLTALIFPSFRILKEAEDVDKVEDWEVGMVSVSPIMLS